jgi:hypothetical protein
MPHTTGGWGDNIPQMFSAVATGAPEPVFWEMSYDEGLGFDEAMDNFVGKQDFGYDQPEVIDVEELLDADPLAVEKAGYQSGVEARTGAPMTGALTPWGPALGPGEIDAVLEEYPAVAALGEITSDVEGWGGILETYGDNLNKVYPGMGAYGDMEGLLDDVVQEAEEFAEESGVLDKLGDIFGGIGSFFATNVVEPIVNNALRSTTEEAEAAEEDGLYEPILMQPPYSLSLIGAFEDLGSNIFEGISDAAQVVGDYINEAISSYGENLFLSDLGERAAVESIILPGGVTETTSDAYVDFVDKQDRREDFKKLDKWFAGDPTELAELFQNPDNYAQGILDAVVVRAWLDQMEEDLELGDAVGRSDLQMLESALASGTVAAVPTPEPAAGTLPPGEAGIDVGVEGYEPIPEPIPTPAPTPIPTPTPLPTPTPTDFGVDGIGDPPDVETGIIADSEDLHDFIAEGNDVVFIANGMPHSLLRWGEDVGVQQDRTLRSFLKEAYRGGLVYNYKLGEWSGPAGDPLPAEDFDAIWDDYGVDLALQDPTIPGVALPIVTERSWEGEFRNEVNTRPGSARYEVQSQIRDRFQEAGTLYRLMEPWASKEDEDLRKAMTDMGEAGDIMDELQIDKSTDAWDASVRSFREWSKEYITDPTAYRQSDELYSNIEELRDSMQKYEHIAMEDVVNSMADALGDWDNPEHVERLDDLYNYSQFMNTASPQHVERIATLAALYAAPPGSDLWMRNQLVGFHKNFYTTAKSMGWTPQQYLRTFVGSKGSKKTTSPTLSQSPDRPGDEFNAFLE